MIENDENNNNDNTNETKEYVLKGLSKKEPATAGKI